MVVLVAHMFGHAAPVGRIARLCRETGMLLFEDCAHAVGTYHGSRHVGQFGDGALFSFGVQKIINTFGGGMLVLSRELAGRADGTAHRVGALHSAMDTFTRLIASAVLSKRLYALVAQPTIRFASLIRSLGCGKLAQVLDPALDNPDYHFDVQSRSPFKPFMKEMCRSQLARIASNVRRRRRIARQMASGLRGIGEISYPNYDRYGQHNAAYLGVYVPEPEALSHYLRQRGIVTTPREFLDCGGLQQFATYSANCPHSRHAMDHLLRLPCYPSLSDTDISRVVSAIQSFFVQGLK